MLSGATRGVGFVSGDTTDSKTALYVFSTPYIISDYEKIRGIDII